MSYLNINKTYKERFKGVENFLRRVAFNLGNSPSQTEVKIISCIPIDVTDLQAKILFLEKQLQESSKQQGNLTKSKQSGITAPTSSKLLCEKSGVISNKIAAVGNKESSIHKNSAEFDGKDIEANNNGGTIRDKGCAVDDKPNKQNTIDTVVNAVLYGGCNVNQSYIKSLLSIKSRNKLKNSTSCISNGRKSDVSSILSVTKVSGLDEHPCCSTSHEKFDSNTVMRNIVEAERKLAEVERYYSDLKNKKIRKLCKGKKGKLKTQLVYFAQNTENNPFNANVYDHLKKFSKIYESNSQAYLDKVMRKQYDPNFVIQEFSDTSHFSQPVCRDTSEDFRCKHMYSYESDVCSCCHGRFQNIDNYLPKDYDFINEITQHDPNCTNKTYYDSNLYDIIPVKDNTNKNLREDNLPKGNIEIKCCPEGIRSKYRNDRTESPPRRCNNVPSKIKKHKGKSKKYSVEQINKSHEIHLVNPNMYKNFSDINRNCTSASANAKHSEHVKTVVLKNELIKTDDLNTKLPLKNQSTQLEVIPGENITESTLSEIKSILQSFLAEVRINAKVNGSLECTPKIDAVVQKGASQNDLHEQSTLLHSFTYNHSYNANPYISSCSRQVPVGLHCFPCVPYQTSLQYLQNFPVFVHPSSGRRLCTCCYKSSLNRCSKYKQASAAATNTDKPEETVKCAANQETEKLIKEIYKSMIFPMDFPTKDNSINESDDVKSDYINVANIQTARSTAPAVVDKRDVEVEALMSSNVSYHSKLASNTTSTQSNIAQTPLPSPNVKRTGNEINHDKILHRFKQGTETTRDITEVDEESESISSDDSEDEEIVEIKDVKSTTKHKKKSLLRRMLILFKKRKEDQKIQKETEAASEVSEYETIYSDKTTEQRPKEYRRNYGHAFYRSTDLRGRRSPYMEQEYRRQWNERLLFEKQQEQKCSSERPFSKQLPTTRPVYWNDYEARSVIINNDNSLPNPPKRVNSKATVSKLKHDSFNEVNDDGLKYKLRWLKKNKFANCGEQWKKFILEN